MTSFWQRRQKNRLYRQWIQHSGLRPEDIPGELQPGKKGKAEKEPGGNGADEAEKARDDITNREAGLDTRTVCLPVRYILYTALLITLLLVALSVVSTILVLRSC